MSSIAEKISITSALIAKRVVLVVFVITGLLLSSCSFSYADWTTHLVIAGTDNYLPKKKNDQTIESDGKQVAVADDGSIVFSGKDDKLWRIKDGAAREVTGLPDEWSGLFALGPGGSMVVSTLDGKLWRVDNGVATEFAGTGDNDPNPSLSPDDARNLKISPIDLKVEADGAVLVVDDQIGQVWRVKDGKTEVIFGTGVLPGPAPGLQPMANGLAPANPALPPDEATNIPCRAGRIAVSPDGARFVSCLGEGRVWRVKDKKASVVPGTTEQAGEVDETERPFEDGLQVRDMAVGPDGSLFILRESNIVWQIKDGKKTMVAGRFLDDDPATVYKSPWHDPAGIAVGPDGSVLVTDTHTNDPALTVLDFRTRSDHRIYLMAPNDEWQQQITRLYQQGKNAHSKSEKHLLKDALNGLTYLGTPVKERLRATTEATAKSHAVLIKSTTELGAVPIPPLPPEIVEYILSFENIPESRFKQFRASIVLEDLKWLRENTPVDCDCSIGCCTIQ